MSSNIIQWRRSATPGAVPTTLVSGEIAINIADGKLYYKNSQTDNIQEINYSASGAMTSGSLFLERSSQSISSATSTLTVIDGTPITPFTLTGSITSTAAPFIAAGRNGQFVILRNDSGAYTLTLSDTNLNGSLMRLSANTVTMAAGSSMGLEYSSTQGAWVELWYLGWVAVTPAIATFTVDAATSLTHEWGDGSTANDTAPAFAATYTGVPSAASVFFSTGALGGESYPYALSSPFLAGTGPVYVRSATRNGTRTMRLSGIVNGVNVTKDVVITYRAPNYCNVSTSGTGLTSAQVIDLTHYLDTDPFATYSSIPATGAGDYIWFAFVAGDATAYYAIGGERAAFTQKDTNLSVTSTYGKVQNYNTFRSDLAQLGTVSVVVQSTAPPTRRYIGRAEQGTQLSEAQIEALAQTDLSTNVNDTWTGVTGFTTNSRMWLCFPGALSTPSHFGLAPNDGNYEEAAFTAQTVQTVTNQYGYVDSAVKNIRSDTTNLHLIKLNGGSTSSTWALKTQAAAFNPRCFVGTATTTSLTSSQILAVDDVAGTRSFIASSLTGIYTITIGASDYLYVCHPSTVADIGTIKDGNSGFAIGGAYLTDVTNHVTDFGVTIPTMRVWRSTNINIFNGYGGTAPVWINQ
jgi:hypothetical protein